MHRMLAYHQRIYLEQLGTAISAPDGNDTDGNDFSLHIIANVSNELFDTNSITSQWLHKMPSIFS